METQSTVGKSIPQWCSLGIPVKSVWTAVKMVADSKTQDSTIMFHSETEDLCKDYKVTVEELFSTKL